MPVLTTSGVSALPPGLTFTGWTSDGSNPANVLTNGGDIIMGSGFLTANSGGVTALNIGITNGSGLLSTSGANIDQSSPG